MYLLIKKYNDPDDGYDKERPIGVFDSILSIETYVHNRATNTKEYNSTVASHNKIIEEMDKYIETNMAKHSFEYTGLPKKNMRSIQEEYDNAKSLSVMSDKYKERFEIAKQTLLEATEFNRVVNQTIHDLGNEKIILMTKYKKEYLESIGETDIRKYTYNICERKVENMEDYTYIEIEMNKEFTRPYGEYYGTF
jgi:hypothetical protein